MSRSGCPLSGFMLHRPMSEHRRGAAGTHPALAHLDHRPWPLPPGPWRWRQSWCDLLFAHWPAEPAALRHLVPDGLEIDTFEGQTWIGVVPFRMAGVMRRPLPDLAGISAFPEINLRLYVRAADRPGVFFLSLDASNALAVWGGRTFFHLPYHRASIDLTEHDGTVAVRAARRGGGPRFEATYAPTGAPALAVPGGLEHFLTERYCLYAVTPGGELWRCEVHHAAWPLQPAEARITTNELGSPHGLDLSAPPAHLLFARRVAVVTWGLDPVA